MIMVGNSRGNGQNLAQHLLSPDNERVNVHAVDGFMSDDLHGAFKEAEAVSKGTRCKKYLFSLSLNPPKDADKLSHVRGIGKKFADGNLGTGLLAAIDSAQVESAGDCFGSGAFGSERPLQQQHDCSGDSTSQQPQPLHITDSLHCDAPQAEAAAAATIG